MVITTTTTTFLASPDLVSSRLFVWIVLCCVVSFVCSSVRSSVCLFVCSFVCLFCVGLVGWLVGSLVGFYLIRILFLSLLFFFEQELATLRISISLNVAAPKVIVPISSSRDVGFVLLDMGQWEGYACVSRAAAVELLQLKWMMPGCLLLFCLLLWGRGVAVDVMLVLLALMFL